MRWKRLSAWEKVILTLASLFFIVPAAIDQVGRLQSIESWLPPGLAKYLPVIYTVAFVIGLAVLGYAKADAPDVVALHERLAELERSGKPRRLADHDKKVIVQTASAGLEELKKNETPEQRSIMTTISLIAASSESETMLYRDDFARVFEAAGFQIELQNWPTAASTESFIGNLTLLRIPGDEKNLIRPIIKRSLTAAGLITQETEYPTNIGIMRKSANPHVTSLVVINPPAVSLVVGPRG